jgi:hypothetical protein
MSNALKAAGPARAPAPGDGFLVPPWAIWIAVLLVPAILAVPWVRHQAELSVLRAPAHYTELAFGDPLHPVDCATGTATITLANHEGRNVSYRYTATVRRGGGTVIRTRRGTAPVRRGATSVVRIETGAPIPARTALWIGLDGRPQQLRATCAPATP